MKLLRACYVPEKEFNSMIQRYGSKMLSDL